MLNIDLMRRLCETPGIPGREERVRELIREEVEDLFDEVTVDPMGSLICYRGPRPAKGGTKKKSLEEGRRERARQAGDAPVPHG